MPSSSRQDTMNKGTIETHHIWSRCAQQELLLGEDPRTGENFDHRRGWLESALLYLADVFAIDLGGYTVLSNHFHLIGRMRPDVVASWPAAEAACRWKMAWPTWRDGRWVREPTDAEIRALLANPVKMHQVRKNLSDLSWYVGRAKEMISKMSNREADKSGCFWDGRFGNRLLTTEVELLCCSLYVDLNQVRAGVAAGIESSQYSSIQARLIGEAQRLAESGKSIDEVQHELLELEAAKARLDFFEERRNRRRLELPEDEALKLYADSLLAPIAVGGPTAVAEGIRLAARREQAERDERVAGIGGLILSVDGTDGPSGKSREAGAEGTKSGEVDNRAAEDLAASESESADIESDGESESDGSPGAKPVGDDSPSETTDDETTRSGHPVVAEDDVGGAESQSGASESHSLSSPTGDISSVSGDEFGGLSQEGQADSKSTQHEGGDQSGCAEGNSESSGTTSEEEESATAERSSRSRRRRRAKQSAPAAQTIYNRVKEQMHRRKSERPFLDMPLSQYIDLVRAVARQIVEADRLPSPPPAGAAAANAPHRNTSRDVSPKRWNADVERFTERVAPMIPTDLLESLGIPTARDDPPPGDDDDAAPPSD